MPLLVSRQDIRERVIREAHRQADTGTVSAPDLNRTINDERRSWAWLVARHDRTAIGKGFRTLSVTDESSTVDVPSEFAALYGMRRSDCTHHAGPQRVLPNVALQAGWLDDDATHQPSLPGAYWLEGPSQAFDVGLGELVTTPQRIRLFPPLPAGGSVTIVYLVQPPEFGNPEDVGAGADLEVIDLISPPNYDAVVAMVRAKAAARGDGAEEQRAIAARQLAVQQTVDDRGREDRHGVISADQFGGNRHGWPGYG